MDSDRPKVVNKGVVGVLRTAGYALYSEDGKETLWRSKDVRSVAEGIEHLKERARYIQKRTTRHPSDVGKDWGHVEFWPEKDVCMGAVNYTMFLVASVNEDAETVRYPNTKRFANGFRPLD